MLSFMQISVKCFRGLNVAKVTNTNSYIQVQKYSRFVSRKHAAIVNEDELFEVEEAAISQEKQTHLRRQNQKSFKNQESNKNEKTFINNEVKKKTAPKVWKKRIMKKPEPQIDSSSKTMFTKLYENEKFLSPLMMEVKSRKRRKAEDKILLEGTRLITDAIQAGVIPEKIIFSNTAELKRLPLPEKDVKMYKVPYRTILLWSSLTSPSGIMGICKTPNVEKFKSPNSLPITIVCDNVRDPGNMGSILRAAAGVGCEKVILSKGCVDLWEPKVLRSAAGAHFRLSIYSYKEWDEIRYMLSPRVQVIVADNNSESHELLNNENEYETIEVTNNTDENVEEERDFKANQKKNNNLDLYSQIPVIPYFSKDFTRGETVIIVGGETEGLSENSFKLVSDTQGVRVNIPLSNGVESLNSGMALGIIAFEIKKQFLIAAEKAESTVSEE